VPGQPDIVIVVNDIDRGKIRLGIQADRSVVIMREELVRIENAALEHDRS
jgi:sRNA-binding carbon storage regulator CsrA